MSLKGTFGESFTDFIWERINEILTGTAMDDEERRKWSDESSELRAQIKTVLDEEHRRLFGKFQDATTAMFTVDIEHAYRQGLKDGVLLKNELGMDTLDRLVS
jgi:hypothetical protein